MQKHGKHMHALTGGRDAHPYYPPARSRMRRRRWSCVSVRRTTRCAPLWIRFAIWASHLSPCACQTSTAHLDCWSATCSSRSCCVDKCLRTRTPPPFPP